ncbi:MAG TPA: SDR family NAD(P)-dependent oxidoreductase [Candidatus Acidoferrum sp.]|nr:SDR family NAD(P)-dependent oxidoreductase [Candidatus Acidoferrum sp.]
MASATKPLVHSYPDRAWRIDALVNNAGTTLISSLEETTIEEAKQLFETDFFGVLRMTQQCSRSCEGSGPARIL